MELKTSGTIRSITHPEQHFNFFLNVTARGTNFPDQITLSGPPGSGLDNVPSTGFFQWEPNERIFVTAHFETPPYPAGGMYRVNYRRQDYTMSVADPQAAARKVLAVPTLQVSGDKLTDISWVYQDAAGNVPDPPPYLRSLDLRINSAAQGPNLYYGDNLPITPASHKLVPPTPRWSDVMHVTFEMTDDLGNIFQSAFQKAIDPVILTQAIPELPRNVPFVFQLELSTYLRTWNAPEAVLPAGSVSRETTVDDSAATRTHRLVMTQLPEVSFFRLSLETVR